MLRLPPPGARIAGPADVVRQGRIMAALHAAGLPMPAIPAMCSGPVVDGRPFMLMEAVEGTRIEKAASEQKPLDIAASAVDVLKRLHAVPLDETGIGDEEPVGLQAEMMRWAMAHAACARGAHRPRGRAGGAARRVQIPVERAPTLVHGDYHYGNMLFRGPAVVAVLDWEIAQIGQPLLDLGCLCMVVDPPPVRGRARTPGGAIDVSIEDLYRLYGADAGGDAMVRGA